MIEADLHVHSYRSFDSLLTPQTIVKTSLKRGLSVIAVTDHGTLKGALETIQKATSTSLVVIPGIELKTNICDIIGLFIEDNNLMKKCSNRMIDEVIDEIRMQNGIAVLSHPFRSYVPIEKSFFYKFDVIEGLNGRMRRKENLKAKKLAFALNKPMIAGSDAHTFFEIGRVRTLFSDVNLNLEDLRQHILQGKTMLVGRESPFLVHIFSLSAQLFKQVKKSFEVNILAKSFSY